VAIWVVRIGADLYVRSWKGPTGSWFRVSQVRHEGHIQAGGVDKDVTFVAEADDDINARIDATYRTKYRRAAMADATSTRSWPLRLGPGRSSWCRAQQPRSSRG
jgi:hypothetical protein